MGRTSPSERPSGPAPCSPSRLVAFRPPTRPAGSEPLILPHPPGKQLLSTDCVHSRGIKITTPELPSRGLQSGAHGSALTVWGPQSCGAPSPSRLCRPLPLQCQPSGTRSASRPPGLPASGVHLLPSRSTRRPGPSETHARSCHASARLPWPPKSHALFPACRAGPPHPSARLLCARPGSTHVSPAVCPRSGSALKRGSSQVPVQLLLVSGPI